MKKVKIAIFLIWHSIIAVLSPVWIGLIYMLTSGHGKGYSYDLGSETIFSVMIGLFVLILWIFAALPVGIWLLKTFYRIKPWMWCIPVLLFTFLFFIATMIFGYKSILSLFGL